jgi:exodeoxyribonuclease VII large subunit
MTGTPLASNGGVTPGAVAADVPRSAANVAEFTVSELSAALKRRIEESFSYVRVRGEISGWKRHSSGHCYLCLKDADAVLDAVCWRNTSIRLPIRPEDGMEVVCTGKLTTFPGRSKYQLVIETMELAGKGALLQLLEERKRKLAAEGLFAPERKKKLPFLPRVIGVVTSPTGAVIRDILHRLNDRFPRHVLLWPVAVQGDGAAQQVAAAIEGFNAIPAGGDGAAAVPRPDVLIVARGGGSLEDLMAFNEEIVVRAAAASAIPLISAVGHETDTTLIDFASDRRAPTPTAAAEMAVPVRLELVAEIGTKGGRLANGLARFLAERKVRLQGLARGLPDPATLLGTAMQRLDDRAERLHLAMRGAAAARQTKLASCGEALDRCYRHFVALERRRLAGVADRLRAERLTADIERARIRLADVAPRLDHAAARQMEQFRSQLDNLAGRLESHRLSHEQVLERGYAMVRDGATGAPLVSAGAVADGAALTIEFHDGEVQATAGAGTAAASEAPPKRSQPRRPTTAATPAPAQGRLL